MIDSNAKLRSIQMPFCNFYSYLADGDAVDKLLALTV